MTEKTIAIDKIRAEAIAAARKNEAPLQACLYPLGSAGARLWMLEYVKEVNRLQRNDRRERLAGEGDAL